MSGITPLLDTLLHQVLGKRVDVPVAPELNAPVRPLTPTDAARAVHSDSRLDARPALAELFASRAQAASAAGQHQSASAPPVSSSSTHFSSAARTIADVLVRFPAPPSVIRPLAPLLPEAGPVSAPQLATRLEGSIRDSGLFYESHLARWFRGDLSRAQLEREPQMGLLSGQAHQSAKGAPIATGPQPSPLALPAPGQILASSTPGPEPLASQDEGSSAARAPVNEAMDDGLQTLVRHQLELLVTPVLRWEGDIWSGLFMALVIPLPEALEQQRQHASGQGEPEEPAQEQAWRTELTLRHGTFGDIRASLCLQGTGLAVTLYVEAEAMVARLENGVEQLRPRLSACGFNEVGIQIRRMPAGDDAGE
ncbi:flagellar hook-length control protein FliK [Zobellella aerophila]|uniref:Flagellar hook-length control protein-like C-terminal domain-containing protein n=1 Tax=Zobellella aerophila TaxID=870480 RepID=A0ABP6VSN0_9GAMM